MKLLMFLMLGAAALAAQEPSKQEQAIREQTAEVAAKVEAFKLKLAQATRSQGMLRAPKPLAQQGSECSIPLRQVGPGPDFRSNTRVIVPDSAAGFAARQVLPPAPPCEEQIQK
ncbi:MAG: hypothetical protein ABI759_01285 [Candidatus Solibacter sp.]